jgi:hypothetical protein
MCIFIINFLNLNPWAKSRMFGQNFNVLHFPSVCQLCPFLLFFPYIYFRKGGNPDHSCACRNHIRGILKSQCKWKLHSACRKHTPACRYHTLECHNYTHTCQNHTLRVKINLVRVEITFLHVKITMRMEITTCVYKSHSCVSLSHS